MFDEIRKVVEKNYYKLQKEAEQKEQARNRLFAAYGLDKADERNNSVRDDLMNAIKKLNFKS